MPTDPNPKPNPYPNPSPNLNPNKVVTCERDDRAAEVARRHFATAGVASRIDLVMGDALDFGPGPGHTPNAHP